MSVRLRTPWTRQPPIGTPLDPRWVNSELTSVFFGSSFIDVRNGKTWTLAGDAKTSVGIAGLCGSYDGTGDYSYVDTTSQSLTLGATILAVVEPNAAPGTDLRAYGIANGGGSGDYFAIGTGATTAAKARVLEVNTGAGTTNVETAATVFEVGKPHCVILRWVYGVGTQSFVDGSIDNFAANSTALAFTYTRTTAGALGRNSFSNNFNGKVYLGAAWARPLSDAKCVALSANPWQLFAPQVRRIWVPQAAAGGTTYNVDISESNAITDAPTSVMLLAAAASEATSAADSLADTATFSVAIVETNATADTVTAVSVLELAVSESAAASEAVTADGTGEASVAESAAASDALAATAELGAAVGETATASDATDWGGAIYTMAVDESTSVADAVATAVQFMVAQSESAGASEALGLVCTFGVGLAESATVADVYAAAADLVALLSETATAADTVAADPAGVINADIAETLAASDGWVAVLIRGFLVVTAPPRRALSGDGVRAANLNRGGRPRNLPGRGR